LGFLKGIDQLKTKTLSSFNRPHFVPNLYDFLTSAEHKISYFDSEWKKETTFEIPA